MLYTEGVLATPILERVVTVKAQNMPLGEVLKNISIQGNFYFSYNANILNNNKPTTILVETEKVREVLKILFGNTYQFKQKGDYLIIQKLKSDEQLIGGYISDKKTGQKLKNVTVYDSKSLAIATTDSFGYYEILTKKPIEQLSIARFNYNDTVFQVKSQNENVQNIDISLLPQSIPEPEDEDEEAIKTVIKRLDNDYTEQTLFSNAEIVSAVKSIVQGIQRVNERNIKLPLSRTWQASIAPYVGSNLGLSGNMINDWSFNATVGYSLGNRKMEVGGIGNINRGKVKGIQIGGIFNIVNGEMKGIQAAGVLNRSKKARGIQIATITNSTDSVQKILQLAGINNYADHTQKGSFQIAGLVNNSEKGKSALQIAAIINNADTAGIQIGLLNRANKLRGLQIGLINQADTASGILLGIINIVKKGYHVLEVSTNELTYANVAYRTGTKSFYSIYTFGATPQYKENPMLMNFGLGFGSSVWANKYLGLTLDITGNWLRIESLLDKKGGLIKIAPAINIQLTQKFGIALAPTWNNYYLPTTHSDFNIVKNSVIPNRAKPKGNWYQWWGWTAAVRFF
jgi:hypothetical protein